MDAPKGKIVVGRTNKVDRGERKGVLGKGGHIMYGSWIRNPLKEKKKMSNRSRSW